MLQDFKAFLLFLCITIFSWIVSYSDFEELLICYGCNQIDPEYDFVIVGGGTAGCVVARRLAENSSASILILEAGGKGNSLLSIPIASPMLQLSNFDWKYTTTRQTGGCLSMENQKCKFPMGKILGGSHQMNNMMYTRGHRSDYDTWFKDLPGYTYEKDVEEYFNRAEQTYLPNETITNTESPALVTPIRHFSLLSTFILTAFSNLGYKVHSSTQKFFGGFYRPMVTMKNGRRWTTSDHLLEMKFPNVAILTKSRAEKIIFRDNEAVGVKFNYLGENMFVKAKRALILSAGTVGSAKLLMLSGIGPKEHLTQMDIKLVKDLPVGNNLQDHLTSGLDMVLVDKPLGIGMSDILNPKAALKYLFQAKGTWTHNGVDFIGFTNEEYMHCKNQIKKNGTLCYEMFAQNRPDLEVMMLPLGVTSDMGIHLRTLFGITDKIWDEYYSKIHSSAMAILPVLLHPKSRGTVRLANKNPNTKPLINPNYLNHPYDIKTLLNFIMHCRKIIDRAKRSKIVGVRMNEIHFPGCEHHEFGSLCYWECYVRQNAMSCYHPIGTCKMGLTEDSVVDYNFQVHGTNKLFVVDGSVLPTQVSGHIMASIIMMAERASEYLKKFHGIEVPKPKLLSSKNPA